MKTYITVDCGDCIIQSDEYLQMLIYSLIFHFLCCQFCKCETE